MNSVEKILVERDGMTREEAASYLTEVRSMCNDALEAGRYYEVEDIIASELGLELDYIYDVIGF